jgi:hypothetical protein
MSGFPAHVRVSFRGESENFMQQTYIYTEQVSKASDAATPVAKTDKPIPTSTLVKALKDANQDFEFYPTTDSQINTISNDILSLMDNFDFERGSRGIITILDVGAGTGKVLTRLKDDITKKHDHQTVNLQAIEKADIQIDSYHKKDIRLVGTEFNEVNFMFKNPTICFTNPPYSDYANWIAKIIESTNFKLMYCIIPARWSENAQIADAIKRRGITRWDVLAESDFMDAERQARAKVQIIRFAFDDFEITTRQQEHRYKPTLGRNATNPFQQFIENDLGIHKTYSDTTEKFSEYQEQERIRKEMETEGTPSHDLVVSRGIFWALLENYEQDLQRVLAQYKLIGKLDPNLLQEIGVKIESIKQNVSDKLFGFRNVYWALLFDQLDALSSRLTTKHKKDLLNTLKANSLDFTYTNATYIIRYGVDLANGLIEQSIVDVFKGLTSSAAISKHYKSNEHVFNDNWRYNNDGNSQKAKYTLDYRFIVKSWGNFGSNSWENGLTDSAREFTNDLTVIFNLLGYSNIYLSQSMQQTEAGDKIMIRGTDPDGKLIELLQVRYYGNGNRHLRWNQNAMLKFNLVASRVLGWVRSKAEFEEEADLKASDEVWDLGDNLKIIPSNILALTHDKRE